MDIEGKEIAPAEQERNEYLAGWKRAQADLANYRADEQRRFAEFAKFAHEAVMKELTAVLDSFSLALRAMPPEDPSGKGVVLIRSQLEDVLKKYGMERIGAASGEPFDPRRHEAVASKPGANGEPPDTVLEEIESGYALNGKVIRPARVMVAS